MGDQSRWMTVIGGDWQVGKIDDQEFDVPSFCPEKPEPDSSNGRFHKNMGGLARMRSLLPNAHYGAMDPQVDPPANVALAPTLWALPSSKHMQTGTLDACERLGGVKDAARN